jgi:hypothetical protein
MFSDSRADAFNGMGIKRNNSIKERMIANKGNVILWYVASLISSLFRPHMKYTMSARTCGPHLAIYVTMRAFTLPMKSLRCPCSSIARLVLRWKM